MNRKLSTSTLAGAMLVAGCASGTYKNKPVDLMGLGTDPRGPTADCPISSSSDWAAWVKPMDQGRSRLVVTGNVTVPSGGYSVALKSRRPDKRVQQIDLQATPPEMTGTPEAPTLAVRGEFPALDDYELVRIHCGARVLATIHDLAPPPLLEP